MSSLETLDLLYTCAKCYCYLSIWFFWLFIFSQCDSRNLNLSPFCNLSTTSLAMWQPSVRETYGILAPAYINETTGPLRLKYPNRMGERELITSLSEVFSSSQRQLLSSSKWHFWPNIGIFGPFGPMPDQKPMQTRCLGGFSIMWVTKLFISPVKKRIFCPKTTKFGPKLAFLVNLGQAMQA